MRKLNFVLLGVVIGLYIVEIVLVIENKNIKKENNDLKEEITDLKWQLNEVPTIIESRKEEICNG